MILPWMDVTGHEVSFPQPCSTMAVTSMAGLVCHYNFCNFITVFIVFYYYILLQIIRLSHMRVIPCQINKWWLHHHVRLTKKLFSLN